MNGLIIDDDIEYIHQLKNKLTERYQNIIIDTFQEPPELYLLKEQYDVIFLDILLNQKKEIDYAIKLKEKYNIMTLVFVSSHNDFIFQTQKVSPLCFIRKSHFNEDFQTFYTLYEEKMQNNLKITFHLNHAMNSQQETYMTLLANDIIYVECFFHELIVHTYNKEFVAKTTLKDFLNRVEKLKCFIQVHRSYAINMNYVYRVDKDYLYMVNEDPKNEIKITKNYKKQFKQVFEEFILL